jgi:CheY-like chemotaxis protein
MPGRVLAVEDNEDLIFLVGFAFEHAGFTFTAARDAGEMRAALAGELPDLVIMDLLLPGINGYQAIQALHEDVRTRDIPVIVITARSEPIFRHMSDDLGAKAHLTKPFQPDALVAEAQAILSEISAAP